MKQICNLVYFHMTDGKTPAQVAEIDVMLAPREDKQRLIEIQNAEAMKSLGGFGMIPPPRRK